MKAAVKKAGTNAAEVADQIESFIDKFSPENQVAIRSVRKALRKRFPTANELVYDNYNFFVIGYSPTERPTDSIVSMAAGANGVGISSLLPIRSGTPNAKLDPDEPFQFQGSALTPTMDMVVKKVPNAMLRLFFTVYKDPANSAKPTVEIEFMRNGQTLQKGPMDLQAPDAAGRIPYLMTIPAAAIPDGSYEIRATAKQGASTAASSTTIKFEQ